MNFYKPELNLHNHMEFKHPYLFLRVNHPFETP